MTPLELLVILILVGAIVVLLYYYLQDTQNRSLLRARSVITETGGKARSTVSGAGEKVEVDRMGGVGEKMSGMGEKHIQYLLVQVKRFQLQVKKSQEKEL